MLPSPIHRGRAGGRAGRPCQPGRSAGAALAVLALGATLAGGCRSNGDGDARSVASAGAVVEADPCEKGASVDPPRREMAPAWSAFEGKRYREAMAKYDALIARFPHSATARVWRGEATLYEFKASDGEARYVKAATDALPFYSAAERLHDRGCRLPDEAQYYLRMGAAYAYLRKGDARRASEKLEKARGEFPDSAEVTYALARAKCVLHDVPACARFLEETLTIARELRRPLFLRTHRSVDEWLRRADTQSELAVLRADPRYAAIVKAARDAD